MRKSLGLTGLLAAVIAATCVWEYSRTGTISLIDPANIRNQLTWLGLFGILGLAQSFAIITGGIDLSIGSTVALVGITLTMLLEAGYPPAAAVGLALLVSVGVGLWHGTLIAKVNLQPFVVTVCSLFMIRGIARFLTGDRSKGFGPEVKWLADAGSANFGIVPISLAALIALAIAAAAFLHFSPSGRHLFALGANEDAARLSGLPTARLKLGAYVACSLLAGIGALFFAFKVQSLAPSNFGSFYELYAIAGAVLGGCSLRGGTGNVLAVILATAFIVLLRNLVNILDISSQLEYIVIGAAILVGVTMDEVMTRRRAARRARQA